MSKSLVAVDKCGRVQFPRADDAMKLFEPHLPCDDTRLRRIYLKLALQYHPDKWPEDVRKEATELFQAIAGTYDKLTRPMGRFVKRVKSRVAAAAELGDLQELEQLLESQPDTANEEDDLGATPLMFAARGGSIDTARLLVKYGASVHARTVIGWSTLTWAGLGDQGDMVRWLASQGVEATESDLELVAFAGCSNSLVALLTCFASSMALYRTDTTGSSLLHLCSYGIVNLPRDSPERYLTCVDLLLSEGVPINAEDKRGRTCLQVLVGHENWKLHELETSPVHLQMVRHLCSKGASPTSSDPAGNSALSLSVAAELPRVRDVLLNVATCDLELNSKL
eukprot:TRINITY_DN43935_c0_g1_i1.p1 TRINITY_DN43935_c0_g1~~TRINITY_DN43935_c0_g1_i1.p1  ORF type:complete len:338 (-),score=36.03 TRINITY_DN43935_c0_g1_i1:118-1131(-)